MSDATSALEPYFEYLDTIANLELKNRVALQGGTAVRYRVARQRQGDRPLTGQLSASLGAILESGNSIILVTGTGNPVWLPHGETDGPSGVAALARAFGALGVRSCILSESRFLPGIRAAVQGAGTPVLSEASWLDRTNGALCLPFPTGAHEAPAFVDALLTRDVHWCAALFIEKPGPSLEGNFHNSSGKPKDSAWVSHAHVLAAAARERGILTAGIGDGGNEVGFGVIREALAALSGHQYGCECGCATGLLDSTSVDFLLPAAVSNWGAYAIVAALALRLGRRDLMPAWSEVKRSILAPIDHGACDGYTGLAVPSVDGVSLRANQAIYHLLEEVMDLATAAGVTSCSGR